MAWKDPARAKAWQLANAERIKAKRRQDYAADPQADRAQNRQYRASLAGVRFCPKGHDTTILGRTGDNACKRCLRDKRQKKLYGLEPGEYEALWTFQNGKCAICGVKLQTPDEIGLPGWDKAVRVEIDHNHDKNLQPRDAVRGLLCGGRWKGCNRKLGNMDKLEWLRQVIHYLENPPAQQFISEKKDSRSVVSEGLSQG